jgi:protein SCO1/2
MQPAARRPQLTRTALILGLICLAAIPLAALWIAFGPKFGAAPDFTLTDQQGKPFTLSAQRGKGVLLFFGYTHCPDICPTTLMNLAKLNRAGTEIAFVTVDPTDTPAKLKAYLQHFDPHFIGLTGTLQQLAAVQKAYKAGSIPDSVAGARAGTSRAIEHTSALYFIDASGRSRFITDWNAPTGELQNDLLAIAPAGAQP